MDDIGIILLVIFASIRQTETATFPIVLSQSANWNQTYKVCEIVGGTLLDYTSLGAVLSGQLPNDSLIWTNDRVRVGIHENTCTYMIKLCGFKQFSRDENGNKLWSGILYADCNSTRSYACKNGTGNLLRVYHGPYSTAIKCKNGPTFVESHDVPPGYYWHDVDYRYLCTRGLFHKATYDKFIRNYYYTEELCGVYNKEIGAAIGDCFSRYRVVCGSDTMTTTAVNMGIHSPAGLPTGSFTGLPMGLSTGSSMGLSTDLPTGLNSGSKSFQEMKDVTDIETSNDAATTIGVPVIAGVLVICGASAVFIYIKCYHKKSRQQTRCLALHTNKENDRHVSQNAEQDKACSSVNSVTCQYDNPCMQDDIDGGGGITMVNVTHNKLYSIEADQVIGGGNEYSVAAEIDDGPEHVYNEPLEENKDHDTSSSVRHGHDVTYNEPWSEDNDQVISGQDEYSFAADVDQDPEPNVYHVAIESNESYDTCASERHRQVVTHDVYNSAVPMETDDVYDSTTAGKMPVRNEIYNHLGTMETDDVYDKTTSGRLPRRLESGEVYNTISVNAIVEGNEYDCTSNVRNHGDITENIYNSTY